MKNKILLIIILSLVSISFIISCQKDEPIDENGLLITTSAKCYMSFFDLLGSDHRTVLASSAVIDTVALTVTAVAKFGTNLIRVKPYCAVVVDAIVEPMMGIWTDFTTPKEYTVISGNRVVRKTYTITVTLQQ